MSRLPPTPDLSADEMELDRQAVKYYCWEIFRKTDGYYGALYEE